MPRRTGPHLVEGSVDRSCNGTRRHRAEHIFFKLMTDSDEMAIASRAEELVRKSRALLKLRRFSESLEIAERLRREFPGNRDALYLVAVNQRYLGRVADALRTLMALEDSHPRFGRLFQERGHCHRAAGETAAAVIAYERAVELNSALTASWRALSELYHPLGRMAEAQKARREYLRLRSTPQDVVHASGRLMEGDVLGAEQLLRRHLRTHVTDVAAMRLLAQVGMKLDVLDDAEFLLESVLALSAGDLEARYEYALVLLRRHKYMRASEVARQLLEIDPQNRAFRTVHANAQVGLGDHEAALRIFAELGGETPENAEVLLSTGHSLKTLGRRQEAIQSYRAAAIARPRFGDAYWSLANLKTYRFEDDEIGRMLAYEADSGVSEVDRYHLCFALGKAFEDRADYARSFEYYDRGNALKSRETRYDANAFQLSVQQQIACCTAESLSNGPCGSDSAAPIFIIGLPRAGSTLLEQILASHSLVEGTSELSEIPRLVLRLSGRETRGRESRYPGILSELTCDQLREFGDAYVAETKAYREGKPFFIDKMPNNFRHLGLIRMILPRAKIIDARREPMACCFSNFKQLFAAGQEFTYSLGDIGRYYCGYVELMRHWDHVFPGKIFRVQYEDLVEDLEGNVRQILEFCDLEFEPRCLEFHKTTRSVRTASSEQVRRPIFRDGIDHWRHFEPWLGPLREALGEA